jgi:hypothetical protein
MAVTTSQLLTVEEFRRLPQDNGSVYHELRHGELVAVTRPKFKHAPVMGSASGSRTDQGLLQNSFQMARPPGAIRKKKSDPAVMADPRTEPEFISFALVLAQRMNVHAFKAKQ